MKISKEKSILAIILLATSFIIYSIHYALFKDMHHILVFLVEDIAFIPIEVLIVTLIIDKLLEKREKQKLMEKLNMVIGLFFSEMGNTILKTFANADSNVENIREKLIVSKEWQEENFKICEKCVHTYEHTVQIEKINLEELECFLKSKRDFLMRLLQNPSLLEHDTFTDLLQSVFHLQEELSMRKQLNELTEKHDAHISIDVKRAYELLSYEWVVYMQYLQKHYPYLFSTALIHNPYNKHL
ncbi:hypothetical protein IZY60_05105 [Lutibacter sp. B2]|nr:hypothetical protein [Lutibacter sp. B2]